MTNSWSLIGDLEHEPSALTRAAGADDRPQRPSDPPLAADHLPDVVFRDMEAEDERVVGLDLFDADRIGVVYELAREVRQQISQCSWP